MCIIAYKPENINFPTDTTLKTCFENNPDGAGFMYPDKDGVHIYKGFMTYEDFDKAISPFKKRKDLPLVMHFRISTHAGIIPEMTQPFPVTSKTRKLKRLDSLARVGVAHNGIISMTSDAKTISDTALFIKRYMSMLIKDVDYYKDERIPEMIEEMIGSKMAILSRDGHVELLGKGWKHAKDGLWYSNDSYEPWNWRDYYKNLKGKHNGVYATEWDDWYGGYDYYDKKESSTYVDLTKEIEGNEIDDWYDFREECQDRYDSGGMACYGCPYESYCHSI